MATNHPFSDESSVHTTDLDLDHMLNEYFVRLTSSPNYDESGRGEASPSNLRSSLHGNATSPETTHTDLGDFSLESPIEWRLTNAVHMEVQENAKIPTFNWNIDRSNSVGQKDNDVYSKPHATTSTDTNRRELSLGFFLSQDQKRGRRSSDASYEFAGALKNGDPRFVPIREKEESNFPSSIVVKPLNETPADDEAKLIELAAKVFPTPLSEIKRKHSPQNLNIQDSTLPFAPNLNGFQFSMPNQTGGRYLFNQGNGVESTSASAKPQLDSSLKSTAIININKTLGVKENVAANATPTSNQLNGMTSTDTSSSAFQPTLEKNRSHPHHHDHLRLIAPPIHAGAHTSSSVAIMNASKQKSQYGFGSKHTVPSIPTMERPKTKAVPVPRKKRQPPPKSRSTISELSVTTSRTTIERPPSATSAHSSGFYSSASYERKKARAKNARVLLNESIDKLAIAIHLAGSQSEQRSKQIEQMRLEKSQNRAAIQFCQRMKSQSDTVISGNNEHSLVGVEDTDKNIVGVIKSCTEIADQAKKWDRPSFIGYSATMIQALNAQCESLTRELVSCHLENKSLSSQLQQVVETSVSRNDVSRLSNDTISSAMKANSRTRDHADNDLNNITEHCEKRRRTDETQLNVLATIHSSHETDNSNVCKKVVGEKLVLERILSFLDTKTKATCLLRVSKSWKNGQSFGIEQIWLDLIVARFGAVNVRQWRAKVENFHEVPSDVVTNRMSEYSSRSLYRLMDDSNVIPIFQRSGNMVFLGEARLPGKVSAWTFLMERSNGETIRSVKQPLDTYPSSLPSNNTNSTLQVYVSIPVVQLWTIIQNTAIGYDEPIVIKEQIQIVDASTRRRKDEMKEIDWDERFQKRLLKLNDFSPLNSNRVNNPASPFEVYPHQQSYNVQSSSSYNGAKELCRLQLFDCVIMETNIHAKGCSTTSKFIQRSNYTEILVQVPNMTTVPLVIPFPRDMSHLPLL